MAGVALGDIDIAFAWEAWRLAASNYVLRGRCGAYGAGLRLVARFRSRGRRGTLRGRRGTWRHPPALCVAGVALGDIDLRLAWQAWHLVTSTTLSHTTLSRTIFHISLSHATLSHTTLSTQLFRTQFFHTHLSHTQLCHLQLCHMQSFTHIHLSHMQLLSHTHLCHTQLCHAALSHTTLPQTTLSHTQLCHTQLFHTQLFTTLSQTIFRTQLCHTRNLSHTTLSHTHSFVTNYFVRHNAFTCTKLSQTIFHVQLFLAQLCRTHNFVKRTIFYTHNFVLHNSSHTTFKMIDPPPSFLSLLHSPCRFKHFLRLLEEVDLWGFPVLQFFLVAYCSLCQPVCQSINLSMCLLKCHSASTPSYLPVVPHRKRIGVVDVVNHG